MCETYTVILKEEHMCETYTVILKEEHRLGMLEKRMLRKIFRVKRVEVTEEWRILHNEELYDL
jgi:hypothetical protein